jgi:phospho-N-acetylmuramoyl-pentapeptide-transferase
MNIVNLFFLLFLVSVLLQASIIFIFRKKKMFQNIYNLSPKTHQQKSLTPSMGGLGMLITIVISFFMFDQTVESTWLFIVVVLFSSIGFLDDVSSLIFGNNQGLTTVQKFVLQLVFSVIVLVIYSIKIEALVWGEYVVYAFFFTGMSNATNLTDGLDGLLAGSSLLSLTGFLVLMLAYQLGFGVVFVFCVLCCVCVCGCGCVACVAFCVLSCCVSVVFLQRIKRGK